MSIKQVREFHQAFGLGARDLPEVGTPEERVLRVRLMLEEVLEFAQAAGIDVCHAGSPLTIRDLYVEPCGAADLASMLHELADVQYVVSGTAVQLGLPLEVAVRAVHAANMRKLGPDGKPVIDARGKVRKPDGWRGADMIEVLDAFLPDRVASGSTIYSGLNGVELTLVSGGEVAHSAIYSPAPLTHAKRPSPCLDPTKMNGYADQFPGSDEGSQYDIKGVV